MCICKSLLGITTTSVDVFVPAEKYCIKALVKKFVSHTYNQMITTIASLSLWYAVAKDLLRHKKMAFQRFQV